MLELWMTVKWKLQLIDELFPINDDLKFEIFDIQGITPRMRQGDVVLRRIDGTLDPSCRGWISSVQGKHSEDDHRENDADRDHENYSDDGGDATIGHTMLGPLFR